VRSDGDLQGRREKRNERRGKLLEWERAGRE